MHDQLGIYASSSAFLAVLGVVQTGFTLFWTPVVYKTFEENPNGQEFFWKSFTNSDIAHGSVGTRSSII